MQEITVYTLFDITETGGVRSFKMDNLPFTTKNGITILREFEWRFARQQQSNLEVLLQVMSLRTQIHDIETHGFKKEPLIKHKFSKNFKGKHNVWSLTFAVEQMGALESDGNPIGALCNDCNHVPMLVNLNETVNDSYLDCNKSNVYFVVNK